MNHQSAVCMWASGGWYVHVCLLAAGLFNLNCKVQNLVLPLGPGQQTQHTEDTLCTAAASCKHQQRNPLKA